jgi:hypothetical protein
MYLINKTFLLKVLSKKKIIFFKVHLASNFRERISDGIFFFNFFLKLYLKKISSGKKTKFFFGGIKSYCPKPEKRILASYSCNH